MGQSGAPVFGERSPSTTCGSLVMPSSKSGGARVTPDVVSGRFALIILARSADCTSTRHLALVAILTVLTAAGAQRWSERHYEPRDQARAQRYYTRQIMGFRPVRECGIRTPGCALRSPRPNYR
jgi:hypothetical protein